MIVGISSVFQREEQKVIKNSYEPVKSMLDEKPRELTREEQEGQKRLDIQKEKREKARHLVR